MTNPVLDLINCHGSVRNYRADPVPTEMVETIIAAAQRTSSSSNLQTYSVIAVTDPAKRQRLSEICGNQAHVAQAPLFLTWCADVNRLDRVCEMRGYRQDSDYTETFLIAAVDAAIACQTAALAAESMGLGICYIGSLRNDLPAVIDLLEVPQHVVPIVGLTVGWPAEAPMHRPRLPLNEILHWETYSTAGRDEALLAYDEAMIATGIYGGRQVPAPDGATEAAAAGKLGADYGWLEHTSRRVAQAVRTQLRAALEKQGFPLR
jgi:FMN reductase (NADPH)